jgi:hypothetical protein
MVSEQEEKMQEAFDSVTGLNVSSGAGGGLRGGWGNGREMGWGVWGGAVMAEVMVMGGVGIL